MAAKRQDTAIMLLGHGSKAKEANETLRRVAAAVAEKGGYGAVVPAFLQMERPDFQEAADIITARGFTEITVMPYFLYPGLHVTQDLPHEIEEARKRHPGLKVDLARHLGFHEHLVDITMERIDERVPRERATPCQHPIEAESFRILTEELGESPFSALELPLVKRIIHSTADFEFKGLVRFSPGAMEAGIRAIRDGRAIITDVKMIEAGITRARLEGFGSKVSCFSADRDVDALAAREGITKTAASMRKASAHWAGGIVAIGNAPTALNELVRLVASGAAAPALVIGVPVGFVGAAESKEALRASGMEYILTEGRKGGSTVAVAAVNALAILAAELSASGR